MGSPKIILPQSSNLALNRGFSDPGYLAAWSVSRESESVRPFRPFFWRSFVIAREGKFAHCLLRFEPEIIRRRWRWRRVFAPTAAIPTVRGRFSRDKTVAGHLFREMTTNRVAIRAEEGSAPPSNDHDRWSAVGRRRERRPPRILGLPVHSRPGGPVCAPCARALAAHPPVPEHGVVAAWCVW